MTKITLKKNNNNTRTTLFKKTIFLHPQGCTKKNPKEVSFFGGNLQTQNKENYSPQTKSKRNEGQTLPTSMWYTRDIRDENNAPRRKWLHVGSAKNIK